MIINNLDLEGIAVSPSKKNSPLVIDTNAMLAGAITFELLQAVAGRYSEILELLGRVHYAELPEHEAVELGGEASDALALEQALRVAIGETRDHRR